MNNGCSNALRALNRLAIALLLCSSLAAAGRYDVKDIKSGKVYKQGLVKQNTIVFTDRNKTQLGIIVAVNESQTKLKVKSKQTYSWDEVSKLQVPTIYGKAITIDDTDLSFEGGHVEVYKQDPIHKSARDTIKVNSALGLGKKVVWKYVFPQELTRDQSGAYESFIPGRLETESETRPKPPTRSVPQTPDDRLVNCWREYRAFTRKVASIEKNKADAIVLYYDYHRQIGKQDYYVGVLTGAGGGTVYEINIPKIGKKTVRADLLRVATVNNEPLRQTDRDLMNQQNKDITIKKISEWDTTGCRSIKVQRADDPFSTHGQSDLDAGKIHTLKRKPKQNHSTTPGYTPAANTSVNGPIVGDKHVKPGDNLQYNTPDASGNYCWYTVTVEKYDQRLTNLHVTLHHAGLDYPDRRIPLKQFNNCLRWPQANQQGTLRLAKINNKSVEIGTVLEYEDYDGRNHRWRKATVLSSDPELIQIRFDGKTRDVKKVVFDGCLRWPQANIQPRAPEPIRLDGAPLTTGDKDLILYCTMPVKGVKTLDWFPVTVRSTPKKDDKKLNIWFTTLNCPATINQSQVGTFLRRKGRRRRLIEMQKSRVRRRRIRRRLIEMRERLMSRVRRRQSNH